jgi:hypothetical protein
MSAGRATNAVCPAAVAAVVFTKGRQVRRSFGGMGAVCLLGYGWRRQKQAVA